MKKFIVLVLTLTLIGETSFAQNSAVTVLPNAVSTGGPRPGTAPVAANAGGIQSAGNQAAGSNGSSIGTALGMGIMFGVLAYGFCQTGNPKCPLYIGGAALAGVVAGHIMSQQKKNNGAADQVTVDPGGTPGNDPTDPTDPTASTIPNGGRDGEGNPLESRYRDTMTRLAPYGTPNKDGSVTMANGQRVNLGDMSASALRAAGYSDKDIKDFAAATDDARKKAEAQAKNVDNNADMFGDTASGGGGSSRNVSAGGSGLNPAGPRSGVDRNPAQVAGMSVSYGGEQIGVGADNIYLMIHRRYELHNRNNGFIDPSLSLAPDPKP